VATESKVVIDWSVHAPAATLTAVENKRVIDWTGSYGAAARRSRREGGKIGDWRAGSTHRT